MSIRNRLMILSLLVLAAGMAVWGWIQLSELETLLYRQQTSTILGIAETVSTYYQHFPTGEGLEALDRALAEQLNEDPSLARVDLLSVSNGVVEYVSGVGRAPFEWSFDLISGFLREPSIRPFPIDLDGASAIGLVVRVPYAEHGPESKTQTCVCVIAYTRSNDTLISNARSFLVYSSSGLLLFILIVLGIAYGWLIDSPLKAIIRVIDQFQAGDFGRRIEIRRRDELGHLAGHFNSMADEIQRVMANNRELTLRQEERIKVATRRLGELQHQVSQLQRISAMGFLAANLAHDLGTPLHSIAGMAALVLERGALGVEDRRKLELILGQAERLSRVITDIRRATRMPEPHPESMSLRLLFDETIQLLEPLLRDSSVELRQHIAADCPLLLADRHRMQTALLNLVQNSLEAIRGKGEITLSAAPDKEKGGVIITVEDSGEGIPPEILDRVCEPFFSTRGDDTLRGLGLAIVHDVVKTHGGSMEIRSKAGEGTLIRLYLPSAIDRDTAPSESP